MDSELNKQEKIKHQRASDLIAAKSQYNMALALIEAQEEIERLTANVDYFEKGCICSRNYTTIEEHETKQEIRKQVRVDLGVGYEA